MAGNEFLVVGVGASAGGVEALQAFFKPMPADPGMAFIVVTHLGERQESAMVQILARSTALPVGAIEDGGRIEPNRVYVLGADAVPTLRRDRLHLRAQPGGKRERNTIDVFFASLADDAGENSVGVVLSGSGHDGTLGLKAIKERGGLTIAQETDHTAPRYPDMPQHAIVSGVVDLKLPVEQMAAKLVEYSHAHRTLDLRSTRTSQAERNRVNAAHKAICEILRADVGHDFSGYKERTFLRRVERRMQVLELRDIEQYVERLRADRQEVVTLFNDLLISVTAFFRDGEAFDAFTKEVIPALFEGKGATDSVRVWVPGCATGEEVYSIAILLLEHLATFRARPKILCFATDIDEPAIAVARAARYPAAMLDSVSPERLERFFTGDGVSYAVAKEVRDVCVFSAHSVIRDPPFSRINLISCRNLLIYLDRDLQSQLMPVFHYALRPGGFLFLGTSESMTQYPDLFRPIDEKHRLFQRCDQAAAHPNLPLVLPERVRRAGAVELPPLVRAAVMSPLRSLIESRVVEQFAPAHVVVTREGEIVHFSSRTGKYLENAAGAPSRQLLAMTRRDLRLDLHTALAEAVESRRPVRRAGLRVEFGDRVQFVDLAVEPLPQDDGEPLFLIVFSDVGQPLASGQVQPIAESDRAGPTEQLEGELRASRERMQSMVEEYETAIEELKSANEELVSVNEELQSTNEELETSREETQSINEELNTVNNELQRKLAELDRANDNLRNLFQATEIGIVFLDGDLVIRSFTPAIRGIFNLMDVDRGRPLTDIVTELDNLDLRREAEPVLASGRSRELRVRRRDGKAHYLMRVLPYRTGAGAIDGLVVTFTDITPLTEIEQYQLELSRRIETMLQTVVGTAERSLAEGAAVGTLLARLKAMTASYRLVARGHLGDVELRELAAQELADFGIGRAGRVTVEGPPLRLKARAAIALGMALHELTANAARQGALSLPQGRLHLGWHIEEPQGPEARLTLRWRESNGPGAGPPAADGFDETLITKGLAETIGAIGAVERGPAGLTAEIVLPLKAGLVVLPDDDKSVA